MVNRALFWHRRDLRIDDNAGLYYALKAASEVIPVFIFDTGILSQLPADDRRVVFIHRSIEKLRSAYQDVGSDLLVLFGDPLTIIPDLALELKAGHVYTNMDYEPAARRRDHEVAKTLRVLDVGFFACKDQLIFAPDEVLKADGKPYTVFTPYARVWKAKLQEQRDGFYLKTYPVESYLNRLSPEKRTPGPDLNQLGFMEQSDLKFPADELALPLLKNYAEQRDIPSIAGTSRLSIHLRFGTISIRRLVSQTLGVSEIYLNELIWREFYQMIIYHFPHSADQSFKPAYDQIQWDYDEALFQAWCTGKTGYPLVDAGMRELNETGFMHNRVRMVTASFLCKHLLIDWRLGERYFALKLLDFDLASNAGGWQWAAGSGCDAAPYFRVFNPTLQLEKFDPDYVYVKKWVPEYGTSAYPKPIVEHVSARLKAIARYQQALKRELI